MECLVERVDIEGLVPQKCSPMLSQGKGSC